MLFSKRLKELRKENKLTQLELAEKLGVAKSTIAGYEKGFRKPKMRALNELAELFNTSADFLIGLTDDRTAKEPSRDLAKLLKEPDFHYKGQPVTNEDLDFLIQYLENITNTKNNTNTNDNDNNHTNESSEEFNGVK